jgi:hypothetical protein
LNGGHPFVLRFAASGVTITGLASLEEPDRISNVSISNVSIYNQTWSTPGDRKLQHNKLA